jgi:hypothetical protein
VAYSDANSHPEPMIELSDDQIAPINPTSRLRPMSVGLVAVSPEVSVAMWVSFFPIVPRGASHSPGEIPAVRE